MSDYQAIRYEVEGGIATITLSRPEKLNAYTPQMGEEVVSALHSARDDDAVRAVILTGAGRGFCAGVDLEELKANLAKAKDPANQGKLGQEDFVRVLPRELTEFPKPVIAAVNGAAIGVGVTMILPCDIRIAAEGAKLGTTFTKLGILPGLGSTHLLPAIVGLGRALELVLTARVIRAEEALELGLVNRVVPGDELLETAREIAAHTMECDPDALAMAKRTVHAGVLTDVAGAMENERQAVAELMDRKAKRK